MAQKPTSKTVSLEVEIVAKSPYAGSGPRGVDVYASHLYNGLASSYSRSKVYLSRDKVSHQHVDIVHFTFFDPFFLTLWNYRPPTKYIVTVHDLIPLLFPQHFPVGIKGKLRWLLQKRALSKASAIITDSVCSQTDIANLIGYPIEKIYVIPLAAGHTTVNEKMVKAVRVEYKLPERYLLYVGDINWNKNIPGLIQSFAQLESKQTHLVLVGKAFESSKSTLEYRAISEAINKSGKAGLIHMLGFVPSHHLPAIYKGATLYIQPSWYEGFGFPILEAMEQGTPVASSSTGSLPEVAGEFAHYFNPGDPKTMFTTISELLKNKEKRLQYVPGGKIWAKSFKWQKVVDQTHAVYEKVHN